MFAVVDQPLSMFQISDTFHTEQQTNNLLDGSTEVDDSYDLYEQYRADNKNDEKLQPDVDTTAYDIIIEQLNSFMEQICHINDDVA